MAATHLLCRGRSNRNRSIFDACFGKHRTWFGVEEKAKELFSSLSTINQASFRLRASPQGDRASFHTTRWLSSSPDLNITPSPDLNTRPCIPCIEFVHKMKLELRLINTQRGFQIHYIVPAEIKGTRVVRFYNSDHRFVQDWLSSAELMVKNQPADLRTVMDRYWLSPDEGTSHDTLLASLMLHCGLQNYLPLFDNYWEETVKIALPFLEEDSEHYLGKILEDFPRGGVYGCKKFVEGLSRIAGKEVSVEFKQCIFGDTAAVGIKLLLDEEKRLINHPEHGTKCCSEFVF